MLRNSEYVVILFDASRSMRRTDYNPSRLESGKRAVKKMIETRLDEDPTTDFALIRFSDESKKLTEFTNLKSELFEELDKIEVGGDSALGDALAMAIKLIIKELRKVGAKIPKIVVFSDGNYTTSAVDPIKMARLAEGLKIKIITFPIGETSNMNILKRLSDLSKGNYHYSNDTETLYESAVKFAQSNYKKSGVGKESFIQNPAFLRKIAANLLRVQDLTKDDEQKIKQIRGDVDYKKCSICFSDTDPQTKGSFFVTGRYCPNCKTPFHLHCLAGWARSQDSPKLKKSGTVRCPHCFYLLKIPTEVTQIQRLKILSRGNSKKTVGSESTEEFEVSIVNSSLLGEEAMYNSCPVCNFIFEEDQEIVKCGNPDCGILYHKSCFKELKNSRCKSCGVKLKL